MGIQNTDNIPNKIENTRLNEYLDYKEIKPLISKYLNIAIEAIPEDNYSKVEKSDILLGDKTIQADGYQIKLKVKDIQSILVKMLETAKNDEQLFNLMSKFNKDITIEEYQESINDTLTELSGEISNEKNIEVITISVYKQGKDTVKLLIEIGVEEPKNKIELSVEKLQNSISLGYDYFNTTIAGTSENKMIITRTATSEEQETIEGVISQIEDGEEQYNAKMTFSRSGAYTSNNISFGMSMSAIMPLLSENASFTISVNNTSDFSVAPQNAEFTEGNHLILNGYTKEQLDDFFAKLGGKILEKLQNEMFISNFDDGLFDLASQAQQNMQEAIQEERELTDQMQGNFDQIPTINPTIDRSE